MYSPLVLNQPEQAGCGKNLQSSSSSYHKRQKYEIRSEVLWIFLVKVRACQLSILKFVASPVSLSTPGKRIVLRVTSRRVLACVDE